MKLRITFLAGLVATLSAFSPNRPPLSTRRPPRVVVDQSSIALFAKDEPRSSKKKPFDEGLRSKLVSEAIAPWRTVRLFFYGSLGSGALIGGLITLAGTAAALSGARDDLDLNTQYMNLAIDFGAVAVFAFLAKWDIDGQTTLQTKVQTKIEKKRERRQMNKGLQDREQQLGTLEVEIQVSADGATRPAAVRELQAGAKQHMIIVVGPRKACKDALVGANLLKMDFAMSNVLVVPYETDADAVDAEVRPTGTGFGGRPNYETQPYVAQPSGAGWDDFVTAEMKDAVAQNGDNVKEEGIVLVVASTGKVVRRGVGKVPWRQMVENLEAEASGKAKKEGSLF